MEPKKVFYLCRFCTQVRKEFGDPEDAPSFHNWIAAVRGHVISFHRYLKLGENENTFLRAIYL